MNMFENNPTLMYGGMRVIESWAATTTEPVRKYKLKMRHLLQLEKQIGKTGCKHPFTQYDRLTKKWLKRYGTKQVPGVMIVNAGNLMIGAYTSKEKVIIAHPTVVKAMKEYDYDGSPAYLDGDADKYDDLIEKNKSYLEPPVQIRWVHETVYGLQPNRSAAVMINTTV
jgi:hypothetical protein